MKYFGKIVFLVLLFSFQTIAKPDFQDIDTSLAESTRTAGVSTSAVGVNLEPESSPVCETLQLASGCCKICRKGKACGDSCIAREKTCHKGPGCACDG